MVHRPSSPVIPVPFQNLQRGCRALVMAFLAMTVAACVPGGLPQPGAATPGRIEAPEQPDGAETWLLPSGAANQLMRTKVYRPAGEGPFPMAVISHGSEQDPARRRAMAQPAYPDLTRFFVEHGYAVVVPERPGHGSGGRYLEDQRGCDDPDYAASANGAADSIGAAVDFMKKQDFVKQQGIVLAGHSAGAFGSLAYAARRPAGVSAIINFSGGRGGHHMNRPGNNCAPGQLVETARQFGATTRVPTLWIYAENDTYFAPALSRAMADTFAEAGGRVDYVLLPPVGSEGHGAIRSNAWRGALTAFIASLP